MRPTVRFLGDALVRQIVAEARAILCDLGVEIHNPGVLALLGDHGARVDLAATRAFLGADRDGRPGWAGRPLSAELSAPGLADGAALDARNRARGVAGFEELLQACAGLGVELIVCEMGLRAEGLSVDQLRSDLPIQRAGLATLLARPGRIVVL